MGGWEINVIADLQKKGFELMPIYVLSFPSSYPSLISFPTFQVPQVKLYLGYCQIY